MDNLSSTPRNFDEFLAGRGILWFCDDSYKVTPKDMEVYLRATKGMNNQGIMQIPQSSTISSSNSSHFSQPVYFSYPENVQPVPSPAMCFTPRNGSTSSLSSLSAERQRSTCNFCRMPLCGEVIVCKEREKAGGTQAENKASYGSDRQF